MLKRPMLALAAVALVAGCGRSGTDARGGAGLSARGARVGVDPIPAVSLFENHSAALCAWRRAGVRDRVLVHVDGHADLDWLPDVTIARLAAADPDELDALQLHPYAVDGRIQERFGVRNFVYPAARMGIVRALVWVVPDGTLRDREAADDFVRRTILGRMQMVSLDEARTLRFEGRTLRGTVLGLDVTVCELADLPAFDEPVLLDVDLDFLTSRSGGSEEVAPYPTATPQALVARLAARGLRADYATVSLSTIGGAVPPACRWLGPALVALLAREPGADPSRFERRAEADALASAGKDAEAGRKLAALAAAHPEDGSIWYALAAIDARSGRASAAAADGARAVAADPLLADAPLFEADALWLNERFAQALDAYRNYRRRRPAGPFLAYTLFREAGCLMRSGRNAEAVSAFLKLIALVPDHADTRMDLGLLLREGGDLDGAIAQLREARRLDPGVAAYDMALGGAYAAAGQSGPAVDALERAVARRPTWGAAQLDLGLLLARLSRPVDAAHHLNAAAQLDPRDPRIARVLTRLRRQGVTTTEVAAHP